MNHPCSGSGLSIFLKTYTCSDSPAINSFGQAQSLLNPVTCVPVTALAMSCYNRSMPAYFAIRLHCGVDILGLLGGDTEAGMSCISSTTRWILPLNGNGAS